RAPPPSTLFPYTTLFRSPDLMDRQRYLCADCAGMFGGRPRLCISTGRRRERVSEAHPRSTKNELRLCIRFSRIVADGFDDLAGQDRKSTRLNSSHVKISY